MDSTNDKKTSLTLDVERKQILDVEQLIKDYAFGFLLHEKQKCKWFSSRKYWRIKKIKDVEIEINYDGLTVESTTALEEKLLENAKPSKKDSLSLVKTVFTNDTDNPQEHNFKTQRETTSSFKVTRESGFSLGGDAKVSFNLPDKIGSVGIGFNGKYDFKKGKENTVTQSVSWGTDSKIAVEKRSHSTAEFIVEEETYQGDFAMTSTLSGTMAVNILRPGKKPGKERLVMVYPCINIVDVFEHFLESSNDLKERIKSKIIGHKIVQIETAGKYNLRVGVRQRIRLSQADASVQAGAGA